MAAASKQALEALHAALARTLTEAITSGVPVADSEGKVHKAPAPASLLAVARGFLADNKIEAPPHNPDLKDLAEGVSKLPFEGDDEAQDLGHTLN